MPRLRLWVTARVRGAGKTRSRRVLEQLMAVCVSVATRVHLNYYIPVLPFSLRVLETGK